MSAWKKQEQSKGSQGKAEEVVKGLAWKIPTAWKSIPLDGYLIRTQSSLTAISPK